MGWRMSTSTGAHENIPRTCISVPCMMTIPIPNTLHYGNMGTTPSAPQEILFFPGPMWTIQLMRHFTVSYNTYYLYFIQISFSVFFIFYQSRRASIQCVYLTSVKTLNPVVWHYWHYCRAPCTQHLFGLPQTVWTIINKNDY